MASWPLPFWASGDVDRGDAVVAPRRAAAELGEGVVAVDRGLEVRVHVVEVDVQPVGRPELERGGETLALVLVAEAVLAGQAGEPQRAQLGHGERGLVAAEVGVRLLPADGAEAVLPGVALGRRRGELEAQGLGLVGEAEGGGEARVGLFREVVVAALELDRAVVARLGDGARGVHLDRAGDAAFFDRSDRGLVDVDAREELGGEDVEVEAAAAVDRAAAVEAAGGSRHFHAVQGDLGELGTEAAHRKRAPFAAFADDRHAGQALDRLRQVEVGQLADVLGDDALPGVDRIPLQGHGFLEGGAVADHLDDLGDGFLLGLLLLPPSSPDLWRFLAPSPLALRSRPPAPGRRGRRAPRGGRPEGRRLTCGRIGTRSEHAVLLFVRHASQSLDDATAVPLQTLEERSWKISARGGIQYGTAPGGAQGDSAIGGKDLYAAAPRLRGGNRSFLRSYWERGASRPHLRLEERAGRPRSQGIKSGPDARIGS